MAATRNVHVVRIKDPDDEKNYVDVKVYDQIAYLGPNGQEMVIDTDAKKAIPNVTDNTGDGNAIENADATRLSHMERFTNKNDTDQYLDLEILDTVAFTSPNRKQGVLHMPSSKASWIVRDDANIGFGGGSGGSRFGHTEKVTDKNSKVAKEDEQDDFTGIVVTDAIAYENENGQRSVLVLPNVQENDTTEYTTDDTTGNQDVPPDNTDPSPYVKFPQGDDGNGTGGTSTSTSGVWLGATPTSAQTGLDAPPDQGMLWKIVNAASNNGPWWPWQPKYQYYGWSIESFGGWLIAVNVHFDTHIIDVWQNDPMLAPTYERLPKIGSYFRGASLQPDMPIQGYTSLDEQATKDPLSLYKMKIDFTVGPQLRFNLPGLGGGWQPNIWQLTGFKQPSHIAQEDDPIKGISKGDTVYDKPSSGLAKKVVKSYKKSWNAATDAYNAMMKGLDHIPTTPDTWWGPDPLVGPIPYAIMDTPHFSWLDWTFAIKRVDGPLGGPTDKGPNQISTAEGTVLGNPYYLEQRMDFCAGLPAGAYFGGLTPNPDGHIGYTLNPFVPAFALPLGVDQLDEKKWDTSGDYPVLRPPPPQ
jgi:hypothetical protein